MTNTKLGGVGERLRNGSGLRDLDLDRLVVLFLLAAAGDLDLERRRLGGVGDLLKNQFNLCKHLINTTKESASSL